jgi:hypothetical protein
MERKSVFDIELELDESEDWIKKQNLNRNFSICY